MNLTDERLEKLGVYYTYFQIGTRYKITFERFVQLVQNGTWAQCVA